jgi:universal stress protein A
LKVNNKIMNTETETSRPGGKDRKAAELATVILKLKSILVPIDFSKTSQTALEYAVPLAEQFGAKVTLLHAIEPLPYPANLTYLPMGEGFPIKPLEEKLNKLAKKTIKPQHLKEVIVQVGTAFEVITNVARDRKADLIVITTHGHTGLKHVFMGSTAERVVRHAPCPVLVVRKCEHQFV